MATNVLIDLVGAKNVNATMRTFGANDIQVLRGVEDTKAFEKGLNNTVTAYDLMLIFEKIAKYKAINKRSSKDMIKILTDQHFNSVIPSKLPKNVVVAHKTGSITGVQNDSGIVYLPDRPLPITDKFLKPLSRSDIIILNANITQFFKSS